MDWKDFFRFNLEKIILLISFSLIAPLPFFALFNLGLIGLAPPALMLYYLPDLLGMIANAPLFIWGYVICINLITFIVHLLFTYLIVCILYKILSKIIEDPELRVAILIILIVITLILSLFFNLYSLNDAGGGSHEANLLDLLLHRS